MDEGSAELPPEDWHPVRILPKRSMWRPRSAPPARRDPQPMIAWCEKRVRHPWKAVLEPDLTQVFWFEHNDDAQRFALRFFPFKCS